MWDQEERPLWEAWAREHFQQIEEEPGDLHYGTRSDLTGSDRITVNTAKHFEASYEGEKVNILIKH